MTALVEATATAAPARTRSLPLSTAPGPSCAGCCAGRRPGCWSASGCCSTCCSGTSSTGSATAPARPPARPRPGCSSATCCRRAIPDVLVPGMPMFGGAVVMILGALAVGSGYGWGTWKTVFTQGPSRAASFGGTLVALAVVVAGLVLATVGARPRPSSVADRRRRGRFDRAARRSAALAASYGGGVLILGMWAAAGVLLGVLARGPALAVGLGLVWSLVVENLLRGVANALPAIEAITNRMPGSSAGSLAGALGGDRRRRRRRAGRAARAVRAGRDRADRRLPGGLRGRRAGPGDPARPALTARRRPAPRPASARPRRTWQPRADPSARGWPGR